MLIRMDWLTVSAESSSQNYYYRPYQSRARPTRKTETQARLSTIITKTVHGGNVSEINGTTREAS